MSYQKDINSSADIKPTCVLESSSWSEPILVSSIASWDLTQPGLYLPSTHKASPVSLCLKSGYFGFFCKNNKKKFNQHSQIKILRTSCRLTANFKNAHNAFENLQYQSILVLFDWFHLWLWIIVIGMLILNWSITSTIYSIQVPKFLINQKVDQ